MSAFEMDTAISPILLMQPIQTLYLIKNWFQ